MRFVPPLARACGTPLSWPSPNSAVPPASMVPWGLITAPALLPFSAGGAVKGRRVIADWPGLKDRDLHENRDLKPTTDLRSVLKGLLAEQFGISQAALAESVFVDSQSVAPLQGLII